MRFSILTLASTALLFSSVVLAQTYTDCNPTTNSSCPSDSALGKTISIDFTEGESSEFTADDGTTITYSTSGAEFTIESDGNAKTIVSNNYIFFGKVEVVLKAAPGTGIVSSFVMESDDLDEIDWEWLGGNTAQVETNYFGKGNTTSYDRATYETVSTPQDTEHTYTIDWTSESVKWYVDDVLVRTLLYADALNGENFPQTPMRIKIGNWVGGGANSSEGTVEWAGGYTDLTEAPFTMYVKSVTVQDYTTSGTTYTYGDMTGSYDSIVISNTTNSSSSSSSSSPSVSYSNTTTVDGNSTATLVNATNSSTSSSATATASNVSANGGSSNYVRGAQVGWIFIPLLCITIFLL